MDQDIGMEDHPGEERREEQETILDPLLDPEQANGRCESHEQAG